jgi:hypothetical protein
MVGTALMRASSVPAVAAAGVRVRPARTCVRANGPDVRRRDAFTGRTGAGVRAARRRVQC